MGHSSVANLWKRESWVGHFRFKGQSTQRSISEETAHAPERQKEPHLLSSAHDNKQIFHSYVLGSESFELQSIESMKCVTPNAGEASTHVSPVWEFAEEKDYFYYYYII